MKVTELEASLLAEEEERVGLEEKLLNDEIQVTIFEGKKQKFVNALAASALSKFTLL